MGLAATKTIQRMDGDQWARIDEASISCSPQRARTDENIAFTVGFKVKGGIRRNFVRPLWEKAYDDHDLGMRIVYLIELHKQRPLVSKPVKSDKFIRRAVFFWTRNPELPYRVWMTVASENETILYPKTEEEGQNMLFDVTRSFEVPASVLGKGKHGVEARLRARWGKHIFTASGVVNGKTRAARIEIE